MRKEPQRTQLDLGVLDALRGLAALYVLLHHARWLLWTGIENYRASGEHGLGLALASTQTMLRFGEQAVLLFFLLSGFCIHYRQARKLAEEAQPCQWLLDLPSYALRRLRRIYPPLVVAIALTAIFDYVGRNVNPAFYAGATGYEAIDYYLFGHGPTHSILTLVGNLLLQASLAVPAFGTDVALWSLSFEFWFYVLYPLALLVSSRWGPKAMLGTTAAISIASLIIERTTGDWLWRVLGYWIIWTLGAFIAETYVGRVRIPGLKWLALGAVALIGGLVANTIRPAIELPGGALTLLWSSALGACLAYVMLDCPPVLMGTLQQLSHRLRPLGNISYSLYLLHCPWLALIAAWWLVGHSTLPLGIELASAGVVTSIALAGVCWYAVERHCVSRSSISRAPETIVEFRTESGVPTSRPPRLTYVVWKLAIYARVLLSMSAARRIRTARTPAAAEPPTTIPLPTRAQVNVRVGGNKG